MIHQTLLRRAVAGRDPVLVDFVDALVPAILTHFAAVPALGGSSQRKVLDDPCLPSDLPRIPPEALERFSDKHDQSMTTHILNGIFAGMRVAEKLPPDKALNDLEKRLWLLGYVVHDYTKVYGIKVAAGELPVIRQTIACLGETLNFAGFLSDWKDYLDDITFLAQNTQTVEGANLSVRDFTKMKTHPRRLEVLRLLSSFADVLVHVTAPSDVAERGSDNRDRANNLNTKLAALFGAGRAPRLAYHRLTEVRGLISNLINNAVMAVLESQGYEPFLFFPNGVVYLVEPGVQASIDVNLPQMIWQQVTGILIHGDSQSVSDKAKVGEPGEEDEIQEESDEADIGGGLGIRPRRGLKIPPVLYEILSPEQLLVEGKNAAMNIRGSAAADRFVSQKLPDKSDYLRSLKGKENEAQLDVFQRQCESDFGVIFDNRTDQIAEFLAFLWRRILGEMFPGLEKELSRQDTDTFAVRDRKLPKGYYTAKEILKWLEISDLVSPEEAAFQKGMRIPTGWYCAAGVYLKKHPELDPDRIEALFTNLSKQLLAYISSNSLHPRQEPKCEAAFTGYVARTLEIDGKSVSFADQDLFTAEIANYVELKANNKFVCSMCSSPFPSSEQVDSVVLFKGQQYSNKGKLGVSQVKRGICPICALEMVLRQIQQGIPAKSAEDDKSIYLYLYPTYFFTPETAQVVKFFLNDLEDLNISPYSESSLIRHLRKTGYQVSSILQYDNFLVEPGTEPTSFKRMMVQAQHYSEKDSADLFLFSLKPKKPVGRNLTDTDAWVLPTFYGLALPLLLNVKVVVTSSFVPVFGTGADFRETTVLDAPHGFTKHVLGQDRFRVDETGDYLIRLLELYDLHLDVFAEPTDLHWPLLNAIAKDVATDPLYVFAYYDRKLRSKKESKSKKKGDSKKTSQGIPVWDIERYVEIYQTLGGEINMGFIGQIVDAYAQFYQAEFSKLDSAHAVLRPLMTAIEVTVESDPQTEHDDLVLLVAGAVNDDQIRVREEKADGWDPIWRNADLGTPQERIALSRRKIEDFAGLFLDKAFNGYCSGDRAILRERTNRIRSAARFYYLQHYSRK